MSKQQLLAFAAEQGRSVTPAQFDRWRKRGLLPSPNRRGLGQGLGIQSRYPESAGPQLVAACDQLAKDRDVDAALWRLWWDGFPIPEARIRPMLESALRDADMLSGAMQRLYDDEGDELSEQLETAALARLKDRDMNRIRRRLGKAKFASFVALLLDVVSGNYGSNDRADAALVAKGFGLSGAPLVRPDILGAMAELFRPDRMRGAFSAARPGAFEGARDELKLLLTRLLPVAIGNSERIFDVKTDAAFGAFLSQALDDISPLVVLIWLPIRAHPLFPVLFTLFSALLLRPLDEWIDRDIPTLIASL